MSDLVRLSKPAEKFFQYRGTPISANPPKNFQSMIEPPILYDIEQGAAGPRFGIACAKDQCVEAGQDQCPRAHGARFKCHVQRGPIQPFGSDRGDGRRQGDHLRMGRWILQHFNLIVPPSDDPILHDHDRTHGNLLLLKGLLGLLDRVVHPLFV